MRKHGVFIRSPRRKPGVHASRNAPIFASLLTMIKWIAIAVGVLVALLIVFLWLRSRSASGGPVSVVIMRRTPRNLTDADVRGAVRRALKAEAKIERIPLPDGLTSGYAVFSDSLPPFVVIDSTRMYFDEELLEPTARRIEDAAARDALRAHKAWISVDAHGLDRPPPKEDRYKIYDRLLGKVASELMDEDATLLYLPAENRIALPKPDSAEKLASGAVAEVFADDSVNQPIIQIEASDAKINAAIKEAKERLPELIGAFERLGAKSHALIKGRFTSGDQVEYLWLEVVSLGAGAVKGKVVNQPYAEGLPAKDSVVDVKLDDIVDWMYLDEKEEAQGMFVERILRSK